MQTAHFRSVQALGHPNVDRENGIIRDVSIMTEGPARGHGVFCDHTTLEQVLACAVERGPAGIAAKFNPLTFNHGPGSIAGHFGEFRIEDTQLLANLFLEPECPSKNYLLNLAANQPNSFGLSIDFDMYAEEIGSKTFARCAALDCVTVVDVPAANTGLFSVGPGGKLVDAQKVKSQLHSVFAFRPKLPPAFSKR